MPSFLVWNWLTINVFAFKWAFYTQNINNGRSVPNVHKFNNSFSLIAVVTVYIRQYCTCSVSYRQTEGQLKNFLQHWRDANYSYTVPCKAFCHLNYHINNKYKKGNSFCQLHICPFDICCHVFQNFLAIFNCYNCKFCRSSERFHVLFAFWQSSVKNYLIYNLNML